MFCGGLGSSFSGFLCFESKQQQLLLGLAASGPQPEGTWPGEGTQPIPGVTESILYPVCSNQEALIMWSCRLTRLTGSCGCEPGGCKGYWLLIYMLQDIPSQPGGPQGAGGYKKKSGVPHIKTTNCEYVRGLPERPPRVRTS